MNCTWSKVKLKKTHDFQRVIKKGKKIANDSFIVFSFKKKIKLEEENNNYCKIGVSVPQKILRKANKRNKCKRQVKSMIFELSRENGFIQKLENWEIVVILRKGYLNSSFEAKKDKLSSLTLFLSKINKKNIKNLNSGKGDKKLWNQQEQELK